MMQHNAKMKPRRQTIQSAIHHKKIDKRLSEMVRFALFKHFRKVSAEEIAYMFAY